MRRTTQIANDRRSTADNLTDTARDMSVNAVKVATESVYLKRDDELVMFSSSAWNFTHLRGSDPSQVFER